MVNNIKHNELSLSLTVLSLNEPKKYFKIRAWTYCQPVIRSAGTETKKKLAAKNDSWNQHKNAQQNDVIIFN